MRATDMNELPIEEDQMLRVDHALRNETTFTFRLRSKVVKPSQGTIELPTAFDEMEVLLLYLSTPSRSTTHSCWYILYIESMM